MYLHLGSDVLVPKASIMGIFDLDNTTVSRITRDYLAAAERDGRVINVNDNLPKSFVITIDKNEGEQVYISQISCSTLKKRWADNSLSTL